MSGEIDPVILQLRADVDRYMRDVERATRRVEDQLARQRRETQRLEEQFRRSSDGISGSLKGIAATLAASFTGSQLIGLIDQFTRFENSLKVAGLEGENLAAVQERLFQTGAKYGVSVNALADLYGKAEQAGRELGASQSDLLALTDAVAQSLLVSGVSTEQASGAILGLSQALASGTVRAEEFNQINEGGLRILLEAAASSERYGGSIAKLRAAVLDGKVSSDEFFRAILANTELVESRAAKANLTLAGATQALTDALSRYVGEAATGSGATGILTSAIQRLADNLDTIIPALATIAVIMGVRMAGAAAAAAIQFVGLRVIALGLAVQLNGTAAAAGLAGRALLAAFGGPVGIAIGAVAIGLTLVANSARGAEAATGEYKNQLEDSRKASESASQAAERLASAHGRTREEALKAAQAERENTKQKLAGARASLVLAQAELKKAQAFQVGQNRASFGAGGVPGTATAIQGRGDTAVATARSNAAAAEERIKNLEGSIATLDAAIVGSAPVAVNTGGGGGKRSGGGGSGTSSPAEVANRFLDEQARLDAEILQAKIGLANSIEDRAALEREFLTFQGDQRRADIDAQVKAKELTAEQGKALKAQIDALYGAAAQYDEQGNVIATYNNSLIAQEIRQREQADLERQRLDVLQEQASAEIEALRLQFDLADTERERRRIALQILDAEERLALAREEEVLQSQTASKEAKALAQIRKDAIIAQGGDRRESTERQFEGPLARFARNAKDSDTRIEEAIVRRVEDINKTIADSFTNALGIKDPFLSELLQIFLEKNIFGPLAEALSGAGGGGFGGLGDIFDPVLSLFGRASGGPVTAGRAYRVNEGASPGRVEAFVPNTSGQIIPLGRMNAMTQGGSGGGGGVATVRLELSGDIDARIERVSGGVAVEVVRATAPQVIDAAANETLRRANRPGL
jgi:tape measure domain-containing protein